jgi:multiple sugar transport system permease protein
MMETNKSDLFKKKIKRLLLGMNFYDGLVYKVAVYGLLIVFSYVYLYPILFMIVNSLKGVDDLINDGVKWVPRDIEWGNFTSSMIVLDIWNPEQGWHFTSIINATIYVLKVSVISTAISALIGYGFARFDFPLKKTMFALMLATFILPIQVMMTSLAGTYLNLGLINSEWTMLLPALFGQGLNQAIFILIFYQFFKTIPQVLYESAEVDGAGQMRIFRSISLPLAIPSIVIVFLFSFVWYWNETYMTQMFAGGVKTLPILLMDFRATYQGLYQNTQLVALNEAVIMAGNLLTILPLLILYFIGQKQFTESIDRTGITGE